MLDLRIIVVYHVSLIIVLLTKQQIIGIRVCIFFSKNYVAQSFLNRNCIMSFQETKKCTKIPTTKIIPYRFRRYLQFFN